MSRTAPSGTSISLPSARPERLGQRLARARSRHPLAFFVGQRLVALVLLGLGVTMIAFILTHLVPGDPAEANLGQRAGSDPVAVQIFREHYGLDKPLPVQYVVYLGNLLHGDMGESEQSRRPVRADLGEYIPATAELALTSIVLSAVLGVALGVLAAFNMGLFTRFTRSAVLEVLENDYVRTARAKGLPERVVIFSHVLRAASPPVITVIGLAFGNVMTGTVLVENIFSWPGIGQYSFRSATTLDLPAIVGVMLFVALVYILANMAVDILYGVLDPRVRLA